MKIHEAQGKQVFRRFGIRVPEGQTATTAEQAQQIATELNCPVMVCKAQIHAGGRGKGSVIGQPNVHGVKVCKSAEEVFEHAKALLGNKLVTHQTGPEGQEVNLVLVEEGTGIARELYTALVLDRDNSCISFIASTEGGMDIEEVAAKTPEKLVTIQIDPATGMMPCHARQIGFALDLEGDSFKQASKMFLAMYEAFVGSDASLLEINPLVVTHDGDIIALDAKLNFDDNALFRQATIGAYRDKSEEDPKETRAKEAGLSYVALEGSIGCLVNGAGLAMATMDIIKRSGGEPANFLDVGGGATAEQVTEAFQIILADENVRAVLVNIFGGIAKCDTIANGIVAAAQEVGLNIPLIVRLEGTNVELGRQILAASDLSIIAASDMEDAATKAVAAAGGAQ